MNNGRRKKRGSEKRIEAPVQKQVGVRVTQESKHFDAKAVQCRPGREGGGAESRF